MTKVKVVACHTIMCLVAIFADEVKGQVNSNDKTLPEPALLQWKFVNETTIHYQHDEETVTRQIGGTDPSEYRVQKTFDFHWDVLSDIRGLKAIAVTFDRVRIRGDEPDKKIAVDTDTPIDPHHSAPGELRLQAEANRTLQTRFAFLAAPNGGIAWPEDLVRKGPGNVTSLPHIFRSPSASNIFTPDSFTCGDAFALTEMPVKQGDKWSSQTRTPDFSADAEYVLDDQLTVSGHRCWRIKGVTKYIRNPAQNKTPEQPGTAKKRKHERLSEALFDPERGLLLSSQEQTTVEVPTQDVFSIQTVISVKRTLLESNNSERNAKVSRRTSGNRLVEFPVQYGIPLPAEQNGVKVVQAGLGVNAIPRDGELPIATDVYWEVGVDTQNHSVRAIHVFDVSDDEPRPIQVKEITAPAGSLHQLTFEDTSLASPEAAWFFETNTAERLIRIVVETDAGESIELFQLILARTLSLRNSDQFVFPETQ